MPVIDCTLRDGGYHTNWNWSDEITEQYFRGMGQEHPEKYLEIGLVGEKGGPYANVTRRMVRRAESFCDNPLTVMVNEKTWRGRPDDLVIACDLAVSLIRIGTKVERIASALDLARALERHGHRVSINLMQISEVGIRPLLLATTEITAAKCADVVYLADSFGSLFPTSVIALADLIKVVWGGPIGFHAHDNLGQASANLRAAKRHYDYQDTSLAGLGRGAGNAVLSCAAAEGPFVKIKKSLPYGAGLYWRCGIQGTHPSYAQALAADEDLSGVEKALILRRFDGADHFSPRALALVKAKL